MAKSTDAAKSIYTLVSEKAFQDMVLERARLYGFWCWHDFANRGRNEAGLPDLILIRPPRILFVELKTERGRVSSVQQGVLTMLDRCRGVESYVWRPSDESVLDAILRPE